MEARRLGLAAGAFLAYVLLGRTSLLLATVHLSSSPVWPPAGFAVGLLVLWGLRAWPIILVGAFVVNATTLGDLGASAMIAAGNTLEAVTAAWIILRFGGRDVLERMSGVAAFFLAAAVGAAVSATIGAGALVASGTPASLFWGIWQTWAFGNLGGTLLVGAAMLTVRGPSKQQAPALLLGILGGLAAFATLGWSLFLVLPLMAWMTIRLRRDALSLGMVGLAAGAVSMTLLGLGPFWGRNANEALLLTQLFLISIAVTALTLSAGLHRRDGKPSLASWGGAALAVGPLVAAAAFIGVALHPTLETLDTERQDAVALEVREAWEDAILDQGAKLDALRGLYESYGEVTRAEFDHFVQLQNWRFGPGGSTAVGFARALAPHEIQAYEAQTRNDTTLLAPVRETFSVFPPPNGSAVAVDHVYPMDPSPGAVGFDLRADPTGAAALDQASSSGMAVSTPPIMIHTPSGELPGFFVSLPVWQDGDLLGFVVLAQTVPDVAAALEDHVPYRIEDLGSGQVLHEHAWDGGPSQPETLEAWGRTWVLDVAVAPRTTGTEAKAPWFVLIGGSVLSIAMSGVVYAHDSTRARAREMSRSLVDQARVDAQRLTEIRRLEDRDDFRRSFLNMVAHELRTPLTPIQAQAYILARRASDADKKAIAILQRGVGRLAAVVDDLLVAAKLEAEGMSLDRQEVDLYAVTHEAVQAAKVQAGEEGTRLSLEGAPELVMADPARIAQVIDNLLTNALKFARGGHVQVTVRRRGDEVEIMVQDDGMGIDPARLKEVGQPFTQVHDIQAVGVKGTGLGLYICKAIAKLHQGRLDVTSQGPGKGTTVRLRLPLE